MSLVQPHDWKTNYEMECQRGSRFILNDAGKKVPLDVCGQPNAFVRLDPLPPLSEALRLGEGPQAALRILEGANGDAMDADAAGPLGVTALMAASAGNHVALARALLERGCVIDRADAAGRTALLHAADAGSEELIALLLKRGASPTFCAATGVTALHLCSRRGLDESCRLLIEGRADMTAEDCRGRRAVDIVADSAGEGLRALLRGRGASSTRLLLAPCFGGFADAQFPRQVWQPLDDLDALIVERIDYPGHGSRVGEDCLRSIESLVDFVWCTHIMGQEGPWAIVGHSMGAIVAYELARRAQRERQRPPVAVILAGAWPPDGYSEYAKRFWFGNASEDVLETDEALVAKMVAIGGVEPAAVAEQDLRDLLVPIWRADFAAELGYHHNTEPLLAAPLYVVASDQDETLPPEEARRWEVCAKGVEVTEVHGGHFFHRDGQSATDFVAYVGEVLRRDPFCAS